MNPIPDKCFLPFPQRFAKYDEYPDGKYLLKLNNGDLVAVYANNDSDSYGNDVTASWVDFEDWMGNKVSHNEIAEICLIKLEK